MTSPFHRPEPNGDGWTDWWFPVRKGYKLGCCGCGLVHDFDFRLVQHGKGKMIQMRARVNSRSTAALRREAKKRAKI